MFPLKLLLLSLSSYWLCLRFSCGFKRKVYLGRPLCVLILPPDSFSPQWIWWGECWFLSYRHDWNSLKTFKTGSVSKLGTTWCLQWWVTRWQSRRPCSKSCGVGPLSLFFSDLTLAKVWRISTARCTSLPTRELSQLVTCLRDFVAFEWNLLIY